MRYTVQALADLAHISPRTLHYYDEIGLLEPAEVGENGYRYYRETELLRLQQILFFRELEFSLDDIKRMMARADFQVVAALRDQKKLLTLKQARLDRLITSISKTITRMTKQQKMSDTELYDAFADDDVKKYQAEVKERWGNTEAYKQSQARVAKMTKAEMAKIKADGEALTKRIAEHMPLGVTNVAVQALIAEHYKGINFFYTCSFEMYRNLGQMYVDDGRFGAYYEKFAPGLAVFMRDAIVHFCANAKQ